MTTTTLPRRFAFNGAILADPDPALTADQVRAMYAGSGYPALTNASIAGPETKDGYHVYTFKQAVGTKG